jgi:hypothetical protein
MIGRSTSIEFLNSTNRLNLEVSRFARRQPSVFRVTSIGVNTETGKIEFSTSPVDHSNLATSNSGNGTISFRIENGLYRLCDVVVKSMGESANYLCKIENGDLEQMNFDEVVDTFSNANEIRSAAEKIRADVTKREELQKIEREENERKKAADAAREAELRSETRAALEAQLEERVIAKRQEISANPPAAHNGIEIAAHVDDHRFYANCARSLAAGTIVNCPSVDGFVVYRALGLSAETREKLVAALDAQAAAGGELKALTGSPKQIAWAEKIRTRVMTSDPKTFAQAVKLKSASRAAFWIEKYK